MSRSLHVAYPPTANDSRSQSFGPLPRFGFEDDHSCHAEIAFQGSDELYFAFLAKLAQVACVRRGFSGAFPVRKRPVDKMRILPILHGVSI